MNATNKKVFDIALRWGLITAGITALCSLTFLVFGLYERMYNIRQNEETLLYLVSLVFGMIYAAYRFKQKNKGFLSIGETIKIGLLTALIAAIGLIFYNLIFITMLYPDYYSGYYYGPLGEQAWEAYFSINPDTHTRELYAVHAEEALSREFKGLYPLTLIMSILVALLVSPVTGIFLRKKNVA